MLDGRHQLIGPKFGPQGYLILDDTDFAKQEKPSAGANRSYTGTLGKVASCQVAMILQRATQREFVGLDAEWYVPQSWSDDPERITTSNVPENVG